MEEASTTTMQHPPSPITLKRPSHLQPQDIYIRPPPFSSLSGTWNVTHSTLPMWEKSKNVKINYTRIDPKPTQVNATTPTHQLHILDTVTHVKLPGQSRFAMSPIQGVDKPFDVYANTPALVSASPPPTDSDLASLGYTWRGTGLLKLFSSQWEIIGHGYENNHTDGTKREWVVTFFKKTLSTPAGVDIYVKEGQGRLSEDTVAQIREKLEGLGEPIRGMVDGKLKAVMFDEEAL